MNDLHEAAKAVLNESLLDITKITSKDLEKIVKNMKHSALVKLYNKNKRYIKKNDAIGTVIKGQWDTNMMFGKNEYSESVLTEAKTKKVKDDFYKEIESSLKRIPNADARKKALKNFKTMDYTGDPLDSDEHNGFMKEALQWAFDWDDSPEGGEYWINVWDSLPRFK